MKVECLDTLVGLSDRTCDCLSGGEPIDYNESESGYYITDVEYGFPLVDSVFANLDCSQSNVWDELQSVRSEAIRDFQGELLARITATKVSKLPMWKGLIGKTDGNFVNNPGVVGIQLRPHLRLKDARFVVTAVYTSLQTPGTYSVELTCNNPDFSTITETITQVTQNWERTPLTTPVNLNFYALNEESLRYNIALNTNGVKGRNNRAWCCQKPGWMNYFNWGGFALNEHSTQANYCNNTFGGIAVEGYFECNPLSWLCELEELNGYSFRDAVARCIQFKAAYKLISRVLESGRVNYWTVLQPENLVAKRQRLADLYSEYLVWIVSNLPGTISGCFGCDKRHPRNTTLYV